MKAIMWYLDQDAQRRADRLVLAQRVERAADRRAADRT